MGWTGTHAIYYTACGKVDRKAECDAVFYDKDDPGRYEILKSRMIGSTYYAAIRHRKEDGNEEVFAAIIMTSVNMKKFCNFYYKAGTEFMGVNECKCPDSILKLLSPTDNDWAVQWRRKCSIYNARRKELNKMPTGKKIEIILNDGRIFHVEKTRIGKITRWADHVQRKYFFTDDVIRNQYTLL